MEAKNPRSDDIDAMLKSKIRNIPNYPKDGVIFRDITPLLQDPLAFSRCIRELARRTQSYNFDYIAGIEARGFIIGGALAYDTKKGFIPIRKKGKLPYDKVSVDYELEYGRQTVEMHKDAVEPGSKVLIVDDLIATGGSAEATRDLIRSVSAYVAGYAFVVELSGLKGRRNLGTTNIVSLVKY